MKNFSRFLMAFILGATFCAVSLGQTPKVSNPAPTDEDATRLKILLERVGDRIQKYHEAMFGIAFTEVVQQQELRADATSKGKPRELIYESVVISRSSPSRQQNSFPVLTRTLKSVDGKPAKLQNLPQRSKCVDTNPQPAYADPLTFLLTKNQSNFNFSYEGEVDLEGRKTAVVLITTPAGGPVKLVDKGECFFLSGGFQRKGKVWIDLNNYDVVQLQWQLAESFSTRIPAGVGRFGILPVFRSSRELSYEKSDSTIRFSSVTFQNPVQILLLPASSEFTWILKGAGIAGFRTTTDYTRYRRFLTTVEIKDSEEDKN